MALTWRFGLNAIAVAGSSTVDLFDLVMPIAIPRHSIYERKTYSGTSTSSSVPSGWWFDQSREKDGRSITKWRSNVIYLDFGYEVSEIIKDPKRE